MPAETDLLDPVLPPVVAGELRAAGAVEDYIDVASTEALPLPRLASGEARLSRRTGDAIKRAFDVVVAGVGLVLSLPVWGLIALAIKLEDRGPVFFTQERVGRGGRHFRSLKFRSMFANSERLWGPRQAAHRDPRITRVGRLIRATGLDELPQLWNIFRGDMSWVGPRALLPAEIEVDDEDLVQLSQFPGFDERHSVRPGLTGIAQVYAPRDITRRNKFRYDLIYVRNRKLSLDLALFAVSCWISLRGRWEHRGPKT